MIDNILVKYTPAGAPVWQWSSLDHIPLAEVDPLWRMLYVVNAAPPIHTT